MKKIVIPQLNANDNSCTIKQVLFKKGEPVKLNDVVMILETSKIVIDLECEEDGIFFPVVKEGSDLKTGELAAFLFSTVEEMEEYSSNQAETQTEPTSQNYKLTNQAIEFMKENQFTEEELLSLNKKIIKLVDLEELLKKRNLHEGEIIAFSRNQKMVSQVVSLSNETIPKAFLLMKVNMNEACKKMQELSKEYESFIGIGEILPMIVAKLKKDFPFFYGKRKDESLFEVAKNVNVGITIDTGNGLFIPVLKEEVLSNIEQVSETLDEFRYKAMRNEFEPHDFMDGVISISLNTNKDISFVLPIIQPGQVAIISVGAIMKELVFENGEPRDNQYFYLGIAYDHRIVNGAYAAEYATVIKEKIENCDF